MMQKKIIILFWILVLVLGTYLANTLINQQSEKALTPDSTFKGNQKIVTIKGYDHQYQSVGTINGAKVKFLVDTGATNVSVPEKIAKQIGLPYGPRAYAQTANGTITVYRTYIKSLSIGNITLNKISASINPYSDDDYILLGMSALKHLEMIHKNNQLILIQTN